MKVTRGILARHRRSWGGRGTSYQCGEGKRRGSQFQALWEQKEFESRRICSRKKASQKRKNINYDRASMTGIGRNSLWMRKEWLMKKKDLGKKRR
jgi:hypothetical protein